MTTNPNPTSPKVTAASLGAAGGAGAGAVVSTLVLWVVGVTAYGVQGDAAHVGDAVAAVPSPISAAVLLVLAIVGAYVSAHRAGWVTTDPLRITPDSVPDGFDDGTGTN